jgi:protocatechuate 3,4-dioxygenase beta subunit
MVIAVLALAASSVLTVAGPQEPGERLRVVGVLQDKAGRPIAGAELYVYQTDVTGKYAPDKPMNEGQARLSGRLTTADDGRFEIRTIRPGGYPNSLRLGDRDRRIPAHIHIDITAAGHPTRRAQVVFADDPLLRDPYWIDWVTNLDQPVVSIEQRGGESVAELILSIP